jgi:hypothetical protein
MGQETDQSQKGIYPDPVSPEIHQLALDMPIIQFQYPHHKHDEVINYLRTEFGFDTNKKSWGSTGRGHFNADGSSLEMHGCLKANQMTNLTIFFDPTNQKAKR